MTTFFSVDVEQFNAYWDHWRSPCWDDYHKRRYA